MAINPKRGEIWRVSLDPTVGAEIQKARPVIVISSDAVGILPLRLIAPVTGWQTAFDRYEWHVRLTPSAQNRLSKMSSIDTLQLRGVVISRFVIRLGSVENDDLLRIVRAINAVIGA